MLEAKNITAGYGKQNVIENATVAFEKGKFTSIIGVNGSGKSTLLKAMLGILPVTHGEAIIDGKPINTLKRNEIAKKLAYLAQGHIVPDMTVGQMVLHGRFPYLSYPCRYTAKDREIALSAMKKVHIEEFADKRLSSLSGGMRQCAYIAMALAQGTDYILLDEPTTYLDISHQLELMQILRGLADEGKGIIAVMHDLPMAFDFSDEIAIVNEKRIILKDTPHKLSSLSAIAEIFGVKIKFSEEENKFFYQYNKI